MSDPQHHELPLSAEDIAEAWLDVQLTRVDGANERAAKRVLALVQPHIDRFRQDAERATELAVEQTNIALHHHDKRKAAEVELVALRSRIAVLETEARIQASRLDDRDLTIGELREEREQIRTLLVAAPSEGALTAARRAGARLDRIAALELELAAAKADGLRVANEAREAARVSLEERRAFQAEIAELNAALAEQAGPDTERT